MAISRHYSDAELNAIPGELGALIRGSLAQPATYRVDVGIDTSGVQRLLEQLSAKQLRNIKRSVMSEVTRRLETRVSKAIREELNLSKAAVDKTIRRTVGDVVGEVIIKRVAVALREYGPRQTRAGVVVKVRNNRPPELLRHTFLVNKLSGQVFERDSTLVPPRPTRRLHKLQPKGRNSTELPIEKRYGPTVLGVLEGKPGLLDQLTAEAQQLLTDRFASKVNFVANQGGRIVQASSSDNG